MIRLTKHRSESNEIVMALDGHLDAESVPQVFAFFQDSEPIKPATLDLSGLISLDLAGRSCLVRLRDAGCRITGGSLYITRLLEEAKP